MKLQQLLQIIKEWFCPSISQLSTLRNKYNTLTQFNKRLQDVIADKRTELATSVDRLSVSQHAIHRYKERIDSSESDEIIEKKLYKALINQLKVMDYLPDGKYSLLTGVVGIVKDQTLTTIIPARTTHRKPRLK